MCYLSNTIHRNIQAFDLPHDWKGGIQDGFGYFFCPVTKTVLLRDPPAAMSMSTIGACSLYNAPRPQIWAHAQSTAE